MVTTRSRTTPVKAAAAELASPTPKSTRKRRTPLAAGATEAPASTPAQPSSVPEEVLQLRREHKKPVSTPVGLLRWVKLQYYRYGVLCGPHCFDFWEGIVLSLLYLIILSLVVYGAYKNMSRLTSFVTERLLQH